MCSPGERGRDREVTLRAGVWTVARTFERGTDWHGLKLSLPSAGAFRSRPARAVGAGPGLCPSADGAVGGRGRGGGSLPAGSPPIVAPGALPSTPPPDSAAGRWALCWLAHSSSAPLLPSSVAKHFWELHVGDAAALFAGTGSRG